MVPRGRVSSSAELLRATRVPPPREQDKRKADNILALHDQLDNPSCAGDTTARGRPLAATVAASAGTPLACKPFPARKIVKNRNAR
jgi:hypothetical protein